MPNMTMWYAISSAKGLTNMKTIKRETMRIKTIIQLILLLAYFNSVQSQDAINAETQDEMENLAEAFLEKTKAPGLSIAVRKNGNTIYAKGFGQANKDANIPMDTRTKLRTASVAKVITATALGVLASEGKLDFDAPIKDYVPYIPDAFSHLTTRQLAGHTAGLAHRPKGEQFKKKQYDDIRETVLLMKAPPLFEADTDYKYSTHAYNLLGAVIEGASGKSYADYMTNFIFKPLHMTHTGPENIDALTQEDAELYSIAKGKVRKAKRTNGSYKVPGAGFRSIPSDLVKMMDAYTNGMISENVVTEMFKSHQLNGGKKTFVGIGWRSAIDPFGNPVIEHAGSWHGARTVIVHYPEEDLNISLMINADCPVLIEETAHLFAQVIRNKKQTVKDMVLTNQKIMLTLETKEKREVHEGTLTMNTKTGRLKTKKKGFLSDSPILYLGSTNDYAIATSYGLLYAHLKNDTTLEGRIFNYFNRSDKNPKSETPLATIQTKG